MRPGSCSVRVSAPTASGSSPAQGVFGISSATHPSSIGVMEYGVHDFAQGLYPAHVIHHAHPLAMPFQAAFQKAQPKHLAQRRRKADRGYIALAVLPRGRRLRFEKMRAGGKLANGPDRLQTDQPRAGGI